MDAAFPATRMTIQRFGLANLASLLLIGLALGCLIYGLRDSLIAIEPWPLILISLIGILLGRALTGIKIPGWLAALLALALGAVIIILGVGRLGIPLFKMAGMAVSWLRQAALLWVFNPENIGSLKTTGLLTAWQEYSQAGQTLWTRLNGWIPGMISERPVYDALRVQMVWAGLIGFASVWATWWLVHRRQPLVGFAPSGILLAASLAYSGAPLFALIAWTGTLLAAQALAAYQQHAHSWVSRHIDSADIQTDWIMAVIPIVAGLMIAAGFLPSLSITKINERISQALNRSNQSDQIITGAFGIKQRSQTASSPLEFSRIPGLPNRHLIGSGPELSKQLVMWVALADSTPGPGTPAYYWRALTYDRYAYWGWYSYPSETKSHPGGEFIPTILQDLPSTRLERIRQNVTTLRKDGGLVYMAGELAQVSEDYQTSWRRQPDIFGAQLTVKNYSAISYRSRPSPEQLQKAGSKYPQWVRDNYLILPENLPQRVWDLALDLTVTKPTAYDRAVALQAYLRQFPYTLDVKPPPPGRDLVDYFLFELKQGYCDYFASAMVVLSRAAGLPARLVVGYASGTYDPQHNRFTVTAADAHAWAEIYFPDYGWVEFEPTSNRALINPIAVQNHAGIQQSGENPPTQNLTHTLCFRRIFFGLLIGLTGAFIILVGWEIGDRLRLRRMPPQQAVIAVYKRLYRQGQHIQRGAAAGLTPHEFAGLLIRSLGARPFMLDQNARYVHRLVDLYARAIYGPQPANHSDQLEAVGDWYNLRSSLWWLRIRRWFCTAKR